MTFHWDIITDNLAYLAVGYRTTLAISALVVAFGLFFGSILAAMRMSGVWVLRLPATIYIEVLRSCPLLMIIFWFYFTLPLLFGFAPPTFATVVVAFSAYRAALIAEVIRSGVLAIPRSQYEAASSLSLGPVKTFRYVILPQATINMLPVLTSQVVATIKASSLAYILGVIDLTRAGHVIMSREFAGLEVFSFVALAYLTTCILVSWCGNTLWRHLRHRTGTRIA